MNSVVRRGLLGQRAMNVLVGMERLEFLGPRLEIRECCRRQQSGARPGVNAGAFARKPQCPIEDRAPPPVGRPPKEPPGPPKRP